MPHCEIFQAANIFEKYLRATVPLKSVSSATDYWKVTYVRAAKIIVLKQCSAEEKLRAVKNHRTVYVALQKILCCKHIWKVPVKLFHLGACQMPQIIEKQRALDVSTTKKLSQANGALTK